MDSSLIMHSRTPSFAAALANFRKYEYDVFLSFSVNDTGSRFTGFLYEALVGIDLKAYRVDEKLRIGELIQPEVLQAIKKSKSAVVILSENYVDSTWCLDELAKIVDTKDLILCPVFYKVDPSDVQRQRNKFYMAKYIYQGNPEIAKDRVTSWRHALERVGNSVGLHVKGDRSESEDVRHVVRYIYQSLKHPSFIDLYVKMEKVESLLRNLGCQQNEIAKEVSGASSSSAQQKRKQKHDVFLSFRGEDTRIGFTGNLYDDLVDKRLNVYMDDRQLPIGKPIRPELLQAIEESKSAIVILSENYADSKWCLDELVKIVECVETRDLILYPVFYRVDPSDVRGQKNNFDLTKLYERNSGIAEDRVVSWKRALDIIFKFLIRYFPFWYRVDPRIEIAKHKLDVWKRALHKVGNAAGFHVKGDRYERDVRNEIVGKISRQLGEKMRNPGFLTTDIVLFETFQANYKRVLEYLKNDEVFSIGIYGMGGVGKTTVMQYVYNQILADPATFGDVCWVTVSRDFSIQKLQDQIFRKLNHDLASEDDEMSRAALLSDILKMKGKYMLILDDVWDNIPLVKVGIPIGVNLGRLIVTTRSLEVCNKMACQQKINISPLSPEEEWQLFMETLGPQEELTLEVMKTAEDVARRCGGLPLAIKTMAGSMKGVDDIREWRNALEDLKKPETFTVSDMASEVFKVLKYSYDRVSLHDEESQQCFLSCALYPEDFEIPRDELIEYWTVTGLIRKRDRWRAEIDKGHTTLNKLVRSCLLEDVSVKGEKCVKMHDLVREMAIHIMKSEKHQQVMVKTRYLKEIPKEEEWTEDLEVVSLIHGDLSKILDGWSPRCPKLSTLMLQRNYYFTCISDSFFIHMRNLQVLNLCDCEGLQKLPDSIGDLINLKALWLRRCLRLEYIPSLRNLKKLEYLDLSGTKIKEVPGSVGGLISLRCLYMACSATMEELMELQHLEVFGGELRNVSDYNVLVRSKWFQQLWDTSLYVTSRLDVMDKSEGIRAFYDERDEKIVVLEELSLRGRGVVDVPCGTKQLGIFNCNDTGKCLLEFGEDARVREWKEIEIEGGREVEWVAAMPSVQLPNIEVLNVAYTENLKGIFNLGATTTPSTTIPIPSRGGDYNRRSFSRLKDLYIYKCHELKVVLTVDCLVHLPMLEELTIRYCSGVEEIIGRGGEDHQHGYHNNNNITSNITLPNLKVLYLSNLPSLKSIYDKGNIICDSIEEILMYGCTGLKRLPLTATTTNSTSSSTSCSGGSLRPPFPHLKDIGMYKSAVEWWESLELVDSTYHPLLRPFVLRHFLE